MNKFSVSAICMDPMHLRQDLKTISDLGIKNVHLDIMDGHFVPRYGIMPETCYSIWNYSEVSMDAHLMVTDPEFAIDQFSHVPNIDSYAFHIDGNEYNAMRIIDKIRELDARVGIALNMGSGFGAAHRLCKFGCIDYVLFMGIHPGVLKPSARAEYLAKSIKYFLSGLSKNHGLDIQVDGAVTFDSIPMLLDAGVTNFVGGSSTIFKGAKDGSNELAAIDRCNKIEENWKKLKELLNV